MKHIILILTFITLSFSSCEKDPIDKCKDDPNCEYFRCKVDGKEWRPNCEGNGGLGCSARDAQYYKDSPSLEIYITNEEQNQSLILFSKEKLRSGISDFVIKENVFPSFNDGNLGICREFKIDTLQSYFFNILEIDTINFIIQAEFGFTGKNTCGTRKIDEGEFRLQYTF